MGESQPRPFLLGREGAETRGATTVETEAQYSLAHLAGTKPLPAKPVHRDVTEELPRELSIDVGAHGAESGPPVRGARVIGAGGDRTEEPGAEVRRGRTRRLTRERERESRCLGGRTAAKRDSAGLAGGAASSRTRPGEGAETRRADKGSLRGRGHRDIGVGNQGGRQGRSGDRESPGRA